MTNYEWISIFMGSGVIVVGFVGWLTHISMLCGRAVAELHAINEKLDGQLKWIERIDEKLDEHERRLTIVESRM